MGIFDKKREISRKDFKGRLQRDRGRIPQGGARRYQRKEREKIAKDLFGPKFGSRISKQDYKRVLRGLREKKRTEKKYSEKEKIEDRIKYLEELGGRSIKNI